MVRAYMAGIVDSSGSFTASVHKSNSTLVGFYFETKFRLTRSGNRVAVAEAFYDWAMAEDLNPNRKTKSAGQVEVSISRDGDLLKMITMLRPFLRISLEDAAILADEIIPRKKDRQHLNPDGLLECISLAEQMPSVDMSKRKYDYETVATALSEDDTSE